MMVQLKRKTGSGTMTLKSDRKSVQEPVFETSFGTKFESNANKSMNSIKFSVKVGKIGVRLSQGAKCPIHLKGSLPNYKEGGGNM